MSGFLSPENFPVSILVASSVIAIVIVWWFGRRRHDGSRIADLHLSFICIFFFGLNSMMWLLLHVQPGLPYGLWFYFPPVILPQLIMFIAFIISMWSAVARHPSVLWLWVLAIAGSTYPILVISFHVLGFFVGEFFALYAFFSLISSIWWFASGRHVLA